MNALAVHSVDSAVLLRYVLEPALRSLALAGGVWLLLKAFRLRDVAFRLAAWTAVLYAALAMPFLGRFLPQLPVPIPIELAAQPSNPPTTAPGMLAAVSLPRSAGALAGESAGNLTATARPGQPATSIPWPALALSLYCTLAGIFLARLALGIFLSRRLRRSSRRIEDRRLAVLLAREARKAGLGKIPPVAESSALSIPATLGIWHPVVLFPPGWRKWSETQTGAVLAHELSHISRHDALTQTLSRLNRALFWFSPLSWWLDRALVDLAEEASDDAALLAGADRTRYAEVLLHFLRTLQAAHGRVRWQSVSMAQGASSTRRLERILSGSRLSRRLGQTALAAVVLSIVPLFCLAASLQPSFSADGPVPLPTVPATPRPPVIASIPSVMAGRRKPIPRVAADATTSHSVSRTAQAAEQRRENAAARIDVHTEMANWYSSEEGGAYVAFAVISTSSVHTPSGTFTEIKQVGEWRGRTEGSVFWFQRVQEVYGARQPATALDVIAAFERQSVPVQQQEIEQEQAGLIHELMELALWQKREQLPSPALSAAMGQMAILIREIGTLRAQGRLSGRQEKIEEAIEAMAASTTWGQAARAQEHLAAALRTPNPSAT